ncbi:MAG: BrnT family toxin, partial [Terriglobales bacterium]
MIDLSKVIGFEWDEGNSRKNEQHGVSMAEAEQVFFNSPLLVLPDPRHSGAELRFHALGKTNE